MSADAMGTDVGASVSVDSDGRDGVLLCLHCWLLRFGHRAMDSSPVKCCSRSCLWWLATSKRYVIGFASARTAIGWLPVFQPRWPLRGSN